MKIKNRWTGETIIEIDANTLYRADLSGADLSRANLYRADLSGADLYRADLSGADLSGADLSGANLYRADLSGANLSGANLSGANLSGANLYRADLYRANLYRANLYRANLYRANLDFAAWSLHCGSLGANVGPRLARQLLYHALAVWPGGIPKEFAAAVVEANKFHRVGECPRLVTTWRYRPCCGSAV